MSAPSVTLGNLLTVKIFRKLLQGGISDMNPHSCHNKPRQPGYWVKDGIEIFHGKGTYKMKYIEDRMTQECGYSKHTKDDPRCDGCKDKV